MTLRLFNTLGSAKADFQPLERDHVRVYSCGPTVHDFAHIGNLRAFLFADLLRRHLQVSGCTVTQVMNITDVDDKIIARAAAEGVSAHAYSARYQSAFFDDLRALRVQPAEHYPQATEHIEQMVALVQRLLEDGHAYVSDGDVYFRVDSFPAYGQLSHLDRAGLKAGARVSQDEYDKESASDFALWKAASAEDLKVGACWHAPFGDGRPGWHIECSAMSMHYLGETFDIHTGGVDLKFPHHENEIAQSQGATGKPLAMFWLHNEHLNLAGAKMSKSLGNFSTLRELTADGHDPLAVRFFLLANAHYRQKLTLDDDALHAAAEQVRRLQDFAERLNRFAPDDTFDDSQFAQDVARARERYRAAMDDDLNLPQAVGHLFELVREANAAIDRGQVTSRAKSELQQFLAGADRHLDILTPAAVHIDKEIEKLISEREAARAGRDFARADALREELRARGIILEDSRDGVRWRRAQPPLVKH